MQDVIKIKNLDLHSSLIIASVSIIAFSMMPSGDPLRAVLLIPLIIFLPGYTIICLLFATSEKKSDVERNYHNFSKVPPKLSYSKSRDSFDESEKAGPYRIHPYLRVVFAFLISIAVSSLAAFTVNELFPLNQDIFGLRPEPTIIILYVLTMLTGIGALIRRSSNKQDEQSLDIPGSVPKKQNTRLGIILTIILSLILVLSVTATFYRLYSMSDDGVTELYLLGKNGEIGDYPDLIITDTVVSMIVGARDTEQRHEGLRLVISTTPSISRSISVLKDPQYFDHSTTVFKNLSMEKNDTYEFRLNFFFSNPGRYSLNFFLMDGDDTLRKIWLNIQVFLNDTIWTSDNEKVRIFLADGSGNPISDDLYVPSEDTTRFTITVLNDELDIFRMNTTLTLEGYPRENFITFSFNDTFSSPLQVQPGDVYHNFTILGAHSRGAGIFEVSLPEGSWTLIIGVNELALNCVLKVKIISI